MAKRKFPKLPTLSQLDPLDEEWICEVFAGNSGSEGVTAEEFRIVMRRGLASGELGREPYGTFNGRVRHRIVRA